MSQNIKNSFNPLIEMLQAEVLDYFQELRNKYSDVRFQMFYSPFYENADIFILGFNPGLGDPDCFDSRERMEFQYLNDRSYPTARDVNYVFEKVGASSVLKMKVLKSNIFYLATRNAGNLYKEAKKFSEESRLKFYGNHFRWIRQLFEKSSPKLMIIEGFNTFHEFKIALEDNNWSIITDFKSENGVFSAKIDLNGKVTPLIGFHRRIYGMLNKDAFAQLLAAHVKQF